MSGAPPVLKFSDSNHGNRLDFRTSERWKFTIQVLKSKKTSSIIPGKMLQ